MNRYKLKHREPDGLRYGCHWVLSDLKGMRKKYPSGAKSWWSDITLEFPVNLEKGIKYWRINEGYMREEDILAFYRYE